MRAAIYARVSTFDQNVSMQIADLRKLAAQRGFSIFREYVDEGQSGGKTSRPALDEMLKDAKRGRFQIVLVWKLDRLGRSTSHLISLLEDFKTWHVQLISFGEGLDFTSTAGKLFYTLLGAFAEFERDTIRERVRAGLRHARARGKTLGRPRKTVDAARIASLRQSGAPWRTISSEMNIPVRSARRAWQNAAS